MYGLKPHIWESIIGCLGKYEHIEEVILYGSRAKGTYKPASDIDLTIKGEKMTAKELRRLENDIDDLLLPWKVDISLFHKLSNQELIDHVERVGNSIYKQPAKVDEE